MVAIEIPAIRMELRGLIFYNGVIPARQLLEIYDVETWHKQQLEDGYQRRLYEERAYEIAKFISTCTVPVIPAILASLRERVEFKGEDKVGMLAIPYHKQAVWVIDGQHRVGGFKVLKDERENIRKGELPKLGLSVEEIETCLDFPLPVLFLDALVSLSNIRERVKPEARERITIEDIERAFFLIVNETAVRLRPSNRDRISYRLIRIGFEGIPVIEKRGKWRADAAELATSLTRSGMPLEGLVDFVGQRGSGRPVQLASFITSLEGLLSNPTFVQLERKEQEEFLKLFWDGLKSRLPLAFSPDRKIRNRYFILRTIAVRALNLIANDIFNFWCKGKVSEADMQAPLDILAQYNWDRKNCPLGAYGGEKGVREAHKALLRELYKKGQAQAKEALMNYGWWSEQDSL